jgi:hypothetical protein
MPRMWLEKREDAIKRRHARTVERSRA